MFLELVVLHSYIHPYILAPQNTVSFLICWYIYLFIYLFVYIYIYIYFSLWGWEPGGNTGQFYVISSLSQTLIIKYSTSSRYTILFKYRLKKRKRIKKEKNKNKTNGTIPAYVYLGSLSSVRICKRFVFLDEKMNHSINQFIKRTNIALLL